MRANGIAEFALLGRTLQWTFPTLKGGNVVRFTVPEYDLTPRDDAALIFGHKQTIADAGAKSNATTQEKFDAMLARVETLNNGEWRGERGTGSDSLLVAAIAAVRQMSESNVRKFLSDKSAAQKSALAASDKYSAKIAELRKARVSGVDVSAIEDELDAL